jgi:hypothetical protein
MIAHINYFRNSELGKIIQTRFKRFLISLTIFKAVPYLAKDFFENPFDYPRVIDILKDFIDINSKIIYNLDDLNWDSIQLNIPKPLVEITWWE